MDREVSKISNDACVLISKSSELFVEYFVTQAYKQTQQERRKVLAHKDLMKSVRELDELEFLTDILPPGLPSKKRAPRKATESRPKLIQGQQTMDFFGNLKPESQQADVEQQQNVSPNGGRTAHTLEAEEEDLDDLDEQEDEEDEEEQDNVMQED